MSKKDLPCHEDFTLKVLDESNGFFHAIHFSNEEDVKETFEAIIKVCEAAKAAVSKEDVAKVYRIGTRLLPELSIDTMLKLRQKYGITYCQSKMNGYAEVL